MTHLDRLDAVERWHAVRSFEGLEPARFDEAGLCPAAPDGLPARAALTRALGSSRARLAPLPEASDPGRFLCWLEDTGGVPVAIGSHGPTAADEVERPGWERQSTAALAR